MPVTDCNTTDGLAYNHPTRCLPSYGARPWQSFGPQADGLSRHRGRYGTVGEYTEFTRTIRTMGIGMIEARLHARLCAIASYGGSWMRREESIYSLIYPSNLLPRRRPIKHARQSAHRDSSELRTRNRTELGNALPASLPTLPASPSTSQTMLTIGYGHVQFPGTGSQFCIYPVRFQLGMCI
jgi:hypothetical protein